MRETEAEPDDAATTDAAEDGPEVAAGVLTVALGVVVAAVATSRIGPTPLVEATPVVVAAVVAGSVLLPGAVVAWRTGTTTPLGVGASGLLVAAAILAYGATANGLSVPLYWSLRDSIVAVALTAVPVLLGPRFADREPFRQM